MIHLLKVHNRRVINDMISNWRFFISIFDSLCISGYMYKQECIVNANLAFIMHSWYITCLKITDSINYECIQNL